MVVPSDKSLINVLNAAVTSSHQQVKSQLNSLIVQVNLIPDRDSPGTADIVADLVSTIKDIEHKLDDVTDWLRVIKVANEE